MTVDRNSEEAEFYNDINYFDFFRRRHIRYHFGWDRGNSHSTAYSLPSTGISKALDCEGDIRPPH